MGCPLTKDETRNAEIFHQNQKEKTTTTSYHLKKHTKNSSNMEMATKIDYKSRLEHKLYLAKETPEPDFDISDCNIKDVPSGVFVLCRVLRKENLNLSKNRLAHLSGGALSDLSLLQILNLNFNKLKQVPEEICLLENLRELLLSNNFLGQLPQTINGLSYLELLDISNNKISTIDEINCMPRLRILNITGNDDLKQLPDTLSTCYNLNDLVLDAENIEWPPPEVVAGGTQNVLRFLLTGEVATVFIAATRDVVEAREAIEATSSATENALMKQLKDFEQNKKNMSASNIVNYYGNENSLLELLQQRQQEQKKEFLQALLTQQNETENLVSKIQQQKDNERYKLIEDILKAEENASIVIDKLLALKNKSDAALIEMERLEEAKLLEELHLKHSDLRKHEVLLTMMDILKDEESKILDYQVQRIASSRGILDREYETSVQLGEFFQAYERNRGEMIERICENEEFQKRAVAALIEKNDARTWSLVEQLKIVEKQLATMTQLEIERKKYSSEEQMNELADKRMRLTYVLCDLLEQQEKRKRQLFDTLMSIEAQKASEQEDFWLLQYQRLIDSRPLEFTLKTNSIDPLLGYNFLVNGVIHCLPFLQKIWQNTEICLEQLTAEDLREAGIRDEKDQRIILKSIEEFLREGMDARIATTPNAPNLSPTSSDLTSKNEFAHGPIAAATNNGSDVAGAAALQDSECVICLEETVKIIFIPCGHMCCCMNCYHKVEICPMCRSDIERKVKVMQP